ncbi:hypothetical protein KUF73_11285 [Pseudomonas sp. PD9R]|nr:hypothetical protein [Pseudomonas sp. PD9R]
MMTARLSKNPKRRVVLLEASNNYATVGASLPPNVCKAIFCRTQIHNLYP